MNITDRLFSDMLREFGDKVSVTNWLPCKACNTKGTITGLPVDNGPGPYETHGCERCNGAGWVEVE